MRAPVTVIVVCLSVILFVCGCSSGKNDEDVKRTILRYNQLLSEGYRNLDMTSLQDVAISDLATKAFYHMAALGEGGLRLDSELKDIAVISIEYPKADEARAKTREKWDFAHTKIASGERYAEERDFIYEMEYKLGRGQGGRWLVRDVSEISAKSMQTVIPQPDGTRQSGRASPR